MKDLPQTAAEVLRRWPGGARKRFGQHYLVSDGIIERIISAAELSPGDRVIEVGPGPGVLTAALVLAGAAVTAVELDRDLAEHIAELLPSVHVVQGDAVSLDLDPLLPGEDWTCVSNLPYNVGTRILLRLLDHPRPLRRLVLMLQREVAERLWAPPGDRKRGSLSVAVQARAEISRVCKVAPGAFRPPPKVDSAVVLLRPRPAAQVPAELDSLLRVAFGAPRKTLRNNLRSVWGDRTADLLASVEVDPGARPAALDLAAWRRVAGVWRSSRPSGAG